MLYLATDQFVPEQAVGRVTIEAIDDKTDAKLSPSLSKPFRRFVGIDGGCSCGFPSALFEKPTPCFDGLFEGCSQEERARAADGVRSIFGLVADVLAPGGTVELYPTWNGDEGLPPKGTTELCSSDIVPHEFCFNERFLYVIRSR